MPSKASPNGCVVVVPCAVLWQHMALLEASTFELSSCRIGRGCYVKPLNKESLGTMGGLALRFLGDPQLLQQRPKQRKDPATRQTFQTLEVVFGLGLGLAKV